ncbi:aspartokinase 2, chloroplastic-like [Bidens hawaiensis]|uniref:aspartokinase 2, chloroplastic-like n=1 Tax=Bidens hawaiensis TaxID=980011 RepID=UPI00404946F1
MDAPNLCAHRHGLVLIHPLNCVEPLGFQLQAGGRDPKVVCDASKNDALVQTESKLKGLEGSNNQLSCVMKFGGSSVASADRMKEVAELILSFPEENPVIVLSAMGKTTNKLILAGEKAASCVSDASEIDELSFCERTTQQDGR